MSLYIYSVSIIFFYMNGDLAFLGFESLIMLLILISMSEFLCLLISLSKFIMFCHAYRDIGRKGTEGTWNFSRSLPC